MKLSQIFYIGSIMFCAFGIATEVAERITVWDAERTANESVTRP